MGHAKALVVIASEVLTVETGQGIWKVQVILGGSAAGDVLGIGNEQIRDLSSQIGKGVQTLPSGQSYNLYADGDTVVIDLFMPEGSGTPLQTQALIDSLSYASESTAPEGTRTIGLRVIEDAAQAIGAEVGLQVGGVDLLVDVVDEIVLLAGLHRTVGAVEVGDVAREVDRRVRAGVDAAGQVAQRGDQARRELGGDAVAAAGPIAVVVVARVGARAHPVAVAGTAVDAAVAALDAELQRFEHVAVEVPGTVDLAVLLPGVVAGPRRAGRTQVDLQDAVLQVLQQQP